jgi:tRNA A-37 threonylcarbamoyl transferase component Bud32
MNSVLRVPRDGRETAALIGQVPIAKSSAPVEWQVVPGWRDLLLGPQGLKLDEWLDEGRARVVKRGPLRTIYRVDLAERTVFVKHVRCARLWQAGRNLLLASASRREYTRAVEIARRQVPAVSPVAFGELHRHGLVHDNYLITEADPWACTWEQFMRDVLPRWKSLEQISIRRKLCTSLARLCAAAHRAGVFHDDLHVGNVLVRVGTCHADRHDVRLPELVLIDLPGVRLVGTGDWRRSADGLVRLGAAWLGQARPSEAWRFWKEYLRGRPDLKLADARAAAATIARRIGRQARRTARRRDQRSLRENRDFIAMRTPLASGHAVADVPRDELRRLLADPERLLRQNAHRPIKLTHRSVVVEAHFPLAAGPTRVAFKRVRAKNWWKSLLFLFRRSRAMAAWQRGHSLLLRGIATARPLAVCERRRFGGRADSYLVSEWIEGAINLHLYGWQLAAYSSGERRRRVRQCAAALGRLLGRMHAWHVSHCDLKGCNLVVVERQNEIDAYLVDVDTVRIARRLSPAERARNLARLATSLAAHPWVTRTDRLRFVRAYLGALRSLGADQPQNFSDWKTVWQSIAAGTLVITRRITRRGRPVV